MSLRGLSRWASARSLRAVASGPARALRLAPSFWASLPLTRGYRVLLAGRTHDPRVGLVFGSTTCAAAGVCGPGLLLRPLARSPGVVLPAGWSPGTVVSCNSSRVSLLIEGRTHNGY